MEQMTKILAIVPARGGSKGLPRKNIIMVRNKPMIAWSVEAALKSKYVSDVVVSSDDDEILSIAKQYGAECSKRPAELAQDDTSTEAVVKYVIQWFEDAGRFYDYILLLQPTSPLRDENEIDRSIEILMSNKESDSLISVCETDNKILKAFLVDSNGRLNGISNNSYPFMRRQDLPSTYMSNGAIYIAEVKGFMEKMSFYLNFPIPYVMSKEKSIDVDSASDVDIINNLERSNN